MPLRSGVHAKRADELSEHKGEIKMPEYDNLHDGEWVTQRLIEARQAREKHLRNKAEIAARNAQLRVEILQHAMRASLRH